MHPPERTRCTRSNSVPALSGGSEGRGGGPRLIDELCSESSVWSSTSDATTARWYKAFQTRAASQPSQPFRSRDVSVRTKRSGRSGLDPTHERESHRCHRSGCRSAGRPYFAGHSRDVRDAGGSLVGRKNERVRSRMTGQSVVDAVTGDHSTDSNLGLLFS